MSFWHKPVKNPASSRAQWHKHRNSRRILKMLLHYQSIATSKGISESIRYKALTADLMNASCEQYPHQVMREEYEGSDFASQYIIEKEILYRAKGC